MNFKFISSCYRYSPITGSIDLSYVNEFKELMDEQDNQVIQKSALIIIIFILLLLLLFVF